MNLVSSFVICVEARTSASLYPARNCAYGLLSACLWFFAAKREKERQKKTPQIRQHHKQARTHDTHASKKKRIASSPILARCRTPPPYLPKYSAAAAPNTRGFGGPRSAPGEARAAAAKSVTNGLGLSSPSFLFLEPPRDPGAMRSKPRARAHRAAPERTSVAAWTSAVLPVAQLLFTFVIGIPVRPSG